MSVEESHAETENVQAGILRGMSGGRRLEIMASLSSAMVRLSRRAIRRANPDASDEELRLLFIEVTYGRELANRIRAKRSR